MGTNLQSMKAWLNAHPLHLETSNADSLVEDLFWYYCENNPSFDQHIHKLHRDIHNQLSKLSVREEDAVFDLFGDVCAQREQLAFCGGLRMGMQLILELLEQK